MSKQIFITFLMFFRVCFCICEEQISIYDGFFVINGDSVLYNFNDDWKNSDVAWLRNERTHLFALVDSNLNVLTDFKFDRSYPFGRDRNSVEAMSNNKWGVVNKLGKVTVDFKYSLPPESIYEKNLKKEFYIFKHRRKECVVDGEGNVIIPFDHINIFNCYYGILEIEKRGRHCLYFLKNNKTIDIANKSVESSFLRSGKTIINDENTGKCGVVDTIGNIIIPCIYDRREAKKFLK